MEIEVAERKKFWAFFITACPKANRGHIPKRHVPI